MHEWKYNLSDRPQIVANEIGELSLDKKEPTESLITWVFDEGSFVPSAKITKDDTFSIVSDYIGKPIAAYNGVGNLVWDVEYDIFGNIRSQSKGDKDFIPFRNQGQYHDTEVELYYNRFRYYSPESGMYISQDPIRLLGKNPNIYAYTSDSNSQADIFGLTLNPLIGLDLNNMNREQIETVLDNKQEATYRGGPPDKSRMAWNYTDGNGYLARIDPPDGVTLYDHIHLYDESGNPIDINGNIVSRESPDAHIQIQCNN